MSDARSAETWRLAARQHGILARPQLLALGFSARAVEHRIAYGRLHRVARGVYAVGWPYLDPRRHWAAAVLMAAAGDQTGRSPTQPYFGNGAVLSHSSAAALWGIGKERPGRTDLTVRRRETPRRPGLRVHGRPSLAPGEITTFDGLPVTSPTQTLVDLATELGPIALERAVSDADKRDLIDPEALRLALDAHAGEPGVRPLRKILDCLTFRLSDSDLEIYFRPIAVAAGLSSPLSKHWVNGFEVDFFWPDLGLVVETDGLRYHRTPSAQKQ
jgi:predicted transcriptional regulator of viral defense system